MSDLREETAALLEERPEVEDGLRELLATDEDGPWEFDDQPFDSGQFGEVVSRGIVEDEGDGYRVADREAVLAAIEGDPAEATADDGASGGVDLDVSVGTPAVDRRVALALCGTLALVAAVRLVSYPSVFQGDAVVPFLNDAYFYRHWIDRVTARSSGPLDPTLVAGLPDDVSRGEPLLVATLAFGAELLGGGPEASGTVLAWYPLLAGLVGAALVYLFTRTAFDDARVGLAAVALLAVTPMHALRTALGFGDHHAFDYVWLGLTAAALVALAVPDRESRGVATWIPSVLFGVGVAGQVLSWEAGPLLALPAAVVVTLLTLSDCRAGESPFVRRLPVVVGATLAAVLVGGAHVALGWQSTAVAATPALLAAGAAAVVGTGELAHRRDLSVPVVAGVEVALGVAAVVGAVVLVPGLQELLSRRIGSLVNSSGPTETRSLVGGNLGFVVGPLLNFGLGGVLAVPYLVWTTLGTYRDHRPKWAVAVAYAWFFLALGIVQVRFAGEASLFLVPFAGLGLVHLAAWVDVTGPPAPFAGSDRDRDRRPTAADGGDGRSLSWPGGRPAAYLAVGFLLVATPGGAVSAAYVDGATIDGDRYGAAAAAVEYATDHDLSQRRVLSRWTYYRMYNYFVVGRSDTYSRARKWYEPFLVSVEPDEQYRNLKPRFGFVVVERHGEGISEEQAYARLLEYGNRTGEYSGLAHYRAIWESDEGSVILFRLVEGAVIAGHAEPNSTVNVSTSVEIEGATFTYSRRVRVGPDGNFSVRVAYPGRYTYANRSVTVPDGAVESGRTINVRGNAGRSENRSSMYSGGFGRLTDPRVYN